MGAVIGSCPIVLAAQIQRHKYSPRIKHGDIPRSGESALPGCWVFEAIVFQPAFIPKGETPERSWG